MMNSSGCLLVGGFIVFFIMSKVGQKLMNSYENSQRFQLSNFILSRYLLESFLSLVQYNSESGEEFDKDDEKSIPSVPKE